MEYTIKYVRLYIYIYICVCVCVCVCVTAKHKQRTYMEKAQMTAYKPHQVC